MEQDWNTVTIQKKKTIGNSAQSIAQAKQAGFWLLYYFIIMIIINIKKEL